MGMDVPFPPMDWWDGPSGHRKTVEFVVCQIARLVAYLGQSELGFCRDDNVFMITPNIRARPAAESHLFPCHILLDPSNVAEELEVHLAISEERHKVGENRVDAAGIVSPVMDRVDVDRAPSANPENS